MLPPKLQSERAIRYAWDLKTGLYTYSAVCGYACVRLARRSDFSAKNALHSSPLPSMFHVSNGRSRKHIRGRPTLCHFCPLSSKGFCHSLHPCSAEWCECGWQNCAHDALSARALPPPKADSTVSHMSTWPTLVFYTGWQLQSEAVTGQHLVESALRTLTRQTRNELLLAAAGRTDAGVHARGQVSGAHRGSGPRDWLPGNRSD